MSKPIARNIVSVLIGLAILFAVFATVQAASSRASLSGESGDYGRFAARYEARSERVAKPVVL